MSGGICVCVREWKFLNEWKKERKRERDREKGGERDTERRAVFVCGRVRV